MQRRKIKGSILTIIGYVLSPLSWWNDILFLPAMVVGYWITNIAGLVLMRYGVVNLVSKEKKNIHAKNW